MKSGRECPELADCVAEVCGYSSEAAASISRDGSHHPLGSAFWRERREFILQRAGHTCEKCGQRRATEVHHLTYIRVFQELPSDLVTLCKPCHAEIHWRQPANDNQLQLSFDFPQEEEKEH
jgi:5-methylcytosine-specific restriction endonuclease McrA